RARPGDLADFRNHGTKLIVHFGDSVSHRRIARLFGGQVLVRFVKPLDAAAVHQPDILVAVNLEQPEPIRREPVIVITVGDDCILRRNTGAADELFERFLADDVAIDLILELGLPIEADRSLDVAGVVCLRIDIDLYDFDPRLAEILFDPVCIDQNLWMYIARHRVLLSCNCDFGYTCVPAAKLGMCLTMLAVYLNTSSGKIMTPSPFVSLSMIRRAPS